MVVCSTVQYTNHHVGAETALTKEQKQNLPDSVTSQNHKLVRGIERHRPDIGKRCNHLVSVAHRLVLLVDMIA